MTPSLKKRSSPVAVLPPTYHFSAPRTFWKPSVLLSLPRLRPGAGIGMPDVAAPVVVRED